MCRSSDLVTCAQFGWAGVSVVRLVRGSRPRSCAAGSSRATGRLSVSRCAVSSTGSNSRQTVWSTVQIKHVMLNATNRSHRLPAAMRYTCPDLPMSAFAPHAEVPSSRRRTKANRVQPAARVGADCQPRPATPQRRVTDRSTRRSTDTPTSDAETNEAHHDRHRTRRGRSRTHRDTSRGSRVRRDGTQGGACRPTGPRHRSHRPPSYSHTRSDWIWQFRTRASPGLRLGQHSKCGFDPHLHRVDRPFLPYFLSSRRPPGRRPCDAPQDLVPILPAAANRRTPTDETHSITEFRQR